MSLTYIAIIPIAQTSSGKIMRRILRKIAEGDTSNLGDISTLRNPEVEEDPGLCLRGGQRVLFPRQRPFIRVFCLVGG